MDLQPAGDRCRTGVAPPRIRFKLVPVCSISTPAKVDDITHLSVSLLIDVKEH